MKLELVDNYVNEEGRLISVWENEDGVRRRKDVAEDEWITGYYDPNNIEMSSVDKRLEAINDG